MAPERLTREDVDSLVEARRELGEEMEPAVIDAFLDRVEAAAEARATARRPPEEIYPGQARGAQLALSIVSLGTGIPITAIAADAAQGLGIAIAWAGIAIINVSFGRRRD